MCIRDSYYSGVGSPGDLEYVNKSGVTQYIGRMDQGAGPGYARVYQAETHVADGYIWTPSDFGYTDAHTGKWRPKRPEDISVYYGYNGFYLDYADNTFDFVYSWGVIHHSVNIKKVHLSMLRQQSITIHY